MVPFFKELTKNRTRAYTLASSGKEIAPLMRLAEATHQVDAARAFMARL